MVELAVSTKYFFHHFDELEHALVIDKVVDTVCFLFVAENVFLSQDRKMLRDVALAGTYLFNDILHTNRVVAQDA